LSSADKGREFFSDAEVRIFWCKNFGVFEIYGVSARTRGIEPVRSFCEQGGRGQFLAILCGLLSWTTPYLLVFDTSTMNFFVVLFLLSRESDRGAIFWNTRLGVADISRFPVGSLISYHLIVIFSDKLDPLPYYANLNPCIGVIF